MDKSKEIDPKIYETAKEKLEEIIKTKFNGNATELAEKSGVSEVSISRMRNSKTKMNRVESLAKIATAAGLPLGFFFGGIPGAVAAMVTTGVVSSISGDIKPTTTPDPSTGLRPIPVISWVQAGEFAEIADPYPPGSGS